MSDTATDVSSGAYTTPQDLASRQPWSANAWVTATIVKADGSACPCPDACKSDCAVRSSWLFDSAATDFRTIHLLQDDSKPPSVKTGQTSNNVVTLDYSGGAESGGVLANNCPPLDYMQCIECDTANGYYPTVVSGEYSIEGIRNTGTGVACYYVETCKEGDSCDTTITLNDLGSLVGVYAGVFGVLLLLFVALRKVGWLRMAIDSAAYVEKGNPKFPPREIPIPMPRETHRFAWLVDAWKRDNQWMKEFTTPDEYMLVRWFKLASRFFFLSSLMCCTILMPLYDNDTSVETSGRVIDALDNMGISKYTLLNARTSSSYGACIAMTWIVSLFLAALIHFESRKYITMMWSVDPNKTGIKANAIVVKDIPLLTTAPVPNKLAKLGAANINSLQTRSGTVKKIFEEDEIGCLQKFKHLITDGTIQTLEDQSKLRLLYKEETMNLLLNKFERVLGKDCIAFKMLASDTRRLDAAAQKWAAAREMVTQTMQAIDDLKDMEKSGTITNKERKQLSKFETIELDDLKRKEALAFDDFINIRDEYINNQAPASSAVVVFARQMDAVIASQIQVDSVPGQWVTEQAPGNSDVVWHNLALTTVERARKTTNSAIFAFFLCLFFMYPVNAVIAAMSDVKGDIVSVFGEAVYNVIVSIILTIFLVIGHVLSLVVSRRTGYVAISSMDAFGASMYFWLLILNLVLGNLSSTPLWEDILDWIKKPHLFTYQFILRLMNTSSFFLQFIMLRCATSPVLEIIHPPVLLGFVTKCLLYRSRARTWPALAKRLVWAQPTPTPSHRVPAQAMLVFFIGTIYAVVAPILLPVCSLFFFFFYIFWKHNMVYHYIQQYSSGTSMWMWLVNKMFFSLVFMQLIVAFGLPTLGFDTMRYRVYVLPLVFLTAVKWAQINVMLKQALKVPVYTAPVKEDKDEGFGDASGSESRASEGEITVTTTKISLPKLRKQIRGVVPNEEMRSSTRKHQNVLASSREAGKAEMEYKIKKGIWQTYAPSVLWPLAAEKSAGSIFLRRWKQIKARKAQEAELLKSVEHLPESDARKQEVRDDLALKKQMRDKAAEAVLRKSTSPYLKEIRAKRAAAEAAAAEEEAKTE